MKLTMIVTFKQYKAGQTVTIENLKQAEWLVSRKYAEPAVDIPVDPVIEPSAGDTFEPPAPKKRVKK